MSTSFSRILATARAHASDAGALAFDVSDDWLQGRSLFGGLQVALALQAMRRLESAAPLRTVQATFVAPIPAGRVEVQARVLRTGKSATHVEARIGDALLVVGVFGSARSSAVRVEPRRAAPAAGDDEGLVLPFIPGVTPDFTQHFAARWVRGSPPFTQSTETDHSVAVAMRDDAAGASDAHLVAIADFIPPIGLSHLTGPAPGSTLTWMLEVLRDRLGEQPLHGWTVDARLRSARDGYTSQSVEIWAPDGALAAVSQQSMLVFG